MKRQVCIYLKMEYKRSIKLLPYLLASFIVTALIFTGATLLLSRAASRSSVIEKVEVGVVVPPSEQKLKMVAGLMEQMESIHTISHITVMSSEEEARTKIKEKQLSVAIIFPPNFYEDVKNGLNPPADVLFSGKSAAVEPLFKDIIDSGVSLLKIAESQVYSVWHLSYKEQLKMSREVMGDSLEGEYVKLVLQRMAVFSPDKEAQTQWTDKEIYVANGFLILLLMCTIVFTIFYSDEDKAIEEKLNVMGIRNIVIAGVKILTICTMLFMISLMLYFVGACAGLYHFWAGSLLYLAVLSVSMTAVIHFIYTVAHGVTTGAVIMLLVNLIMIATSSQLIGNDHFPAFVRWLSQVTPYTTWLKGTWQNLYKNSLGGILIPIIFAAILFAYTNLIKKIRGRG